MSAISLLNRHPQLKTFLRGLLGVMPGARSIATRIRRSLPSVPAVGAATERVPSFKPVPVNVDGVITVEGLYHLSRSL